jgi:hypothetical protein
MTPLIYLDAPARGNDRADSDQKFHFITSEPVGVGVLDFESNPGDNYTNSPWDARRLGQLYAILFDGIGAETLNGVAKVSQHPMDQGIHISDHSQTLGRKYDVTAWLAVKPDSDDVEYDISGRSRYGGYVLTIVPPRLVSRQNRRALMEEALYAILGVPGTIFSVKHGILHNFVLERFRVVSDTTNRTAFALNFTEIRRASSANAVIAGEPRTEIQKDSSTESPDVGDSATFNEGRETVLSTGREAVFSLFEPDTGSLPVLSNLRLTPPPGNDLPIISR